MARRKKREDEEDEDEEEEEDEDGAAEIDLEDEDSEDDDSYVPDGTDWMDEMPNSDDESLESSDTGSCDRVYEY